MTLIELYRSYGEKVKASRDLLEQTNWFFVNADFDPKTGEALPQALSTFLKKITKLYNDGIVHDRLLRITNHARESVERIFRALKEDPRRKQELLPIYLVRELNVNSFIKLSNRPGRTIREKLKDKPYLYAVRRFQSVDLTENRLLKEFVTRLAELLELRHDCLKEKEEDELLPKIKSWLLSDEAQDIARWENLPPNNTLLSHRDYRRIWDAWRWLQTLDEDIDRDLKVFEIRKKTMDFWRKYGQKYIDSECIFADMPVYFNYEEREFKIDPWVENPVFRQINKKFVRCSSAKKSEPVCVDFTVLRPRYSAIKDNSQEHSDSKGYKSDTLYETYLWQHWEKNDKFFDVELFNSDALYLHPDVKTTISSADLFFSKEKQDKQYEHFDSAARAFASKLRKTFTNDTLIWLVPDFLNDFELEIIRRNINARFPKAEPLPRSVAAVFEQIDYSIITKDKFTVVVVDTIGGKTCATKLIARFDPALNERIPETRGFFWVRCPVVIITNNDPDSARIKNCEIITVDEKGIWRNKAQPKTPQFLDLATLNDDKRIGQFDLNINLSESPVVGGIRLHDLQQKAGDIPLWRDHIPELKTKLMIDGIFQDYILVSRNTIIKPIRGKPVPIKINDFFTLPSGKRFYEFPLFQGENDDEVGFSATLEPPVSLDKDTVCRLKLTFTYGENDPYCLVFEPLKNEFSPIQAKWQKKENITDAAAPEYPNPLSWEDLKAVPKLNNRGTNNLLDDWIIQAIDRFRPQDRIVGVINERWDNDNNNASFFTVECRISGSVRVYENNYFKRKNYRDIKTGDKISFELKEKNGKFFSIEAVDAQFLPGYLANKIRKSLYYPFIEIWKDGRSITDEKCPLKFANDVKERIAYLDDLINKPEIPQYVKNELLFLLACTHRDTTEKCKKWITWQIEQSAIQNPRAVGFALGDVSQEWQKDLLLKLKSPPTEEALRVFAYAIWHEEYFYNKFSVEELRSILDVLKKMLSQIRKREKDKLYVRDWGRAAAEPLELLLGLLRTRQSSDSEIKMLLQPHQKIIKELAEQVERIADMCEKSNVRLLSRVQLRLKDSENTLGLLDALRLYLAGDDTANAISIRVSDNDDNYN